MGIGRVWLIGTLDYMSKPCSRRALDIYSTRRKRAQCTTAFFSHGSSKGAGGGHDPFRLHGLAWQECRTFGAAKRVAPEKQGAAQRSERTEQTPAAGLTGQWVGGPGGPRAAPLWGATLPRYPQIRLSIPQHVRYGLSRKAPDMESEILPDFGQHVRFIMPDNIHIGQGVRTPYESQTSCPI